MMYKFISTTILFALAQIVAAQTALPVIKSSSKLVTIRDGLHLREKVWNILPDKKPDYYYAEMPRKEHVVTFITDQDSISFDVKYGGEYDFIILLNNKDSCYTRIAARHRNINSYKANHATVPHDTIPFTIGNNSKIYFKGSINNSAPLDIQFDLGAGGCIIKKSSVKKVNMSFDASVTLTNSDGTNQVPLSSSNTLQIAGLRWDSLGFAVADNMTHREDLLVGNSLFLDKIVEIDYDKKIMIIHDSLPAHGPGYSRHDIILDGVVPFLQGSVSIGSKKRTGWFMFDTGAYTSILSTDDVSVTHKMYMELRKMLGLSISSPQITIGEHAFSGFNYTAQKINDGHLGLLGNDLLKRFNVILDNRSGYIYLKPNSLVNESYANPEYYAVRVGAAVLIFILALVVYIRYRRKIKRNRRNNVAG